MKHKVYNIVATQETSYDNTITQKNNNIKQRNLRAESNSNSQTLAFSAQDKMATSITIKGFYLTESQSIVESQGCQILTDHGLNTPSYIRISNSSETLVPILGYLQRRRTLLLKATEFFVCLFC